MMIVFVIIVLLPSLPVWGVAVYFSFALMRKKRYKRKDQGCISSATALRRKAKGARTRFAQTIAPFNAFRLRCV